MSNHSKAIIIVILSGLIWSFGPLVVKNMTEPQMYQLPYLVIRGLTVAIIISCYLLINEGISFLEKILKIDNTTMIGALCLTTAFLGFIYSISFTTAAVTLFMLALMPFLASIIAFIFLSEKISAQNFLSMVVALIGTVIMIYASSFSGSIFGLIMGFISSLGFAAFSVTLRSKSDYKKFYILVYGGVFCALISSTLMIFQDQSFFIPLKNIFLSICLEL